METHVLRAEQVPCAVAEQVFAGMLLHNVEAPFEIQLAVHGGADGDRAVHAVQEPFADLVHVRNGHAVQRADVAGLSALVREERAAVKLD